MLDSARVGNDEGGAMASKASQPALPERTCPRPTPLPPTIPYLDIHTSTICSLPQRSFSFATAASEWLLFAPSITSCATAEHYLTVTVGPPPRTLRTCARATEGDCLSSHLHPLLAMIETSRWRFTSALNSRYIYGRLVCTPLPSPCTLRPVLASEINVDSRVETGCATSNQSLTICLRPSASTARHPLRHRNGHHR